ncbi:hypothetical protein I4U23_029600 [Adineta vaga]|nr:hypothetical protein I4U23_029600 [Adineta vaga]
MSTSSATTDDDRVVAKCYVELGNVTKEKGEYDESLRYHRKSMEIFERIDDPLSVADSHLNIAEIYKAKGELKQAMNEYEIGFSLYEDVYVDDANKNSDSGTDVSLNSSSFCDPQHARSLSKSEEILPQAVLINTTEKNTSPSSSPHRSIDGVLNTSTTSLNRLNSSSKNIGIIDDSALIPSKKLSDRLLKSLSSSCTSDLQNLDDPDMFLPTTLSDLAYETTHELTPDIDDLLERCAPLLTSLNSSNQDELSSKTDLVISDTNVEEMNDNVPSKNAQATIETIPQKQNDLNHRFEYYLPIKQILIVVLVIFLTGVFYWSLQAPSQTKSKMTWSSGDSSVNVNSRSHHTRDDLGKQFRKFLTWRKNQLAALDKHSRQLVEDFISSGSNIRSKMTIEKFQKLLDMLDLKIVLVPR